VLVAMVAAAGAASLLKLFPLLAAARLCLKLPWLLLLACCSCYG
jgi:hypothetical protein